MHVRQRHLVFGWGLVLSLRDVHACFLRKHEKEVLSSKFLPPHPKYAFGVFKCIVIRVPVLRRIGCLPNVFPRQRGIGNMSMKLAGIVRILCPLFIWCGAAICQRALHVKDWFAALCFRYCFIRRVAKKPNVRGRHGRVDLHSNRRLTSEGDSFHLLTNEFRLGFRTFCSLFYVSTLASGHEELLDSFCLALFSLCVMSLTYWIVFLALFVHILWYSVPAPFCLLKLSVRINAFDN